MLCNVWCELLLHLVPQDYSIHNSYALLRNPVKKEWRFMPDDNLREILTLDRNMSLPNRICESSGPVTYALPSLFTICMR